MSEQPIKGNACPARVLVQLYKLGDIHIVLPHEELLGPDGKFIWPVDPRYCNDRLRACRHCGCLYLEVK